jgi:hypothetical protein
MDVPAAKTVCVLEPDDPGELEPEGLGELEPDDPGELEPEGLGELEPEGDGDSLVSSEESCSELSLD